MNSRNRMLLGLLLLIACFAVGYLFTTAQWRNYSNSKIELQAATEKNIQLNDALSSIQSFVDTYNAQSSQIATVNMTLPAQTSDAAGIVSGLGELATAAGVTLMDLQMQETAASVKTTTPYSIQTQPMSLSASGSFESFKDFILRLENHMRLFDLKRISLSQDESGQMEYRIDLQTYYQQ